jgi:hypothetical protein
VAERRLGRDERAEGRHADVDAGLTERVIDSCGQPAQFDATG